MCANDSAVAIEPKITCIEVRVGGEWGTFFVKEFPITPRENGKGLIAAAMFVAHTSRGHFGYRWSDMGQPFSEFIAECDHSYILRKVGTKELNERLAVSNVKREVLEARREKRITAEVAKEAMATIARAVREFSGDVLCHELYHAAELSFIQDWGDISTQDYSHCTKVFMDKLWPEFVRKFCELSQTALQGSLFE